nr:transposase domain-containing protein [Pectobacterium carotovorum]
MLLSQALNTVHKFTPEAFSSLSERLSPEIIDECLTDTGIVTIRKRRLPMEMMVWAVTGMTLFRSLSMNQVAPGKIAKIINEIVAMAGSFVLPTRRARHYPRAVKKKPQRYALRLPSKA